MSAMVTSTPKDSLKPAIVDGKTQEADSDYTKMNKMNKMNRSRTSRQTKKTSNRLRKLSPMKKPLSDTNADHTK